MTSRQHARQRELVQLAERAERHPDVYANRSPFRLAGLPPVRDLRDDLDALEYPAPRRPPRGDLEDFAERPTWWDL